MSDLKKSSTNENATEGVVPTEADAVAQPEQPPMDDDASGLPDEEAEKLGDFA